MNTARARRPIGELCDLIAEPVRPGTRPDALYLGLEHLASGRLVRIGGGQASEMRSSTSAGVRGEPVEGEVAVITREQADYKLSPSRWVGTTGANDEESLNNLVDALGSISVTESSLDNQITSTFNTVERM